MFKNVWLRFTKTFYLDLRSLALFRVCLAGLIILDLLSRSFWLKAHYTDKGVLPRSALLKTMWDPAWFSVHMFSGAVEGQSFLFILAGLVAVLLLIGWWTQLMTVLSWMLMVSLHARNPAVLQGGDTVFRLLLFWGAFLPLGARWSVDAALSGTQGSGDKNCYKSITSFAYILQICFIYLFSAILKTGDAWLVNFNAVYYALAINQFTTNLGDWLFSQNILHKPLTLGTLSLEAFGWILLLIPVFKTYLRLISVGAFIGMHLGFAATMQLGLFSYIMCAAWLALLPGAIWNFLSRQIMSFGKESYFSNLSVLLGGFYHLEKESITTSNFLSKKKIYNIKWNIKNVNISSVINSTKMIPKKYIKTSILKSKIRNVINKNSFKKGYSEKRFIKKKMDVLYSYRQKFVSLRNINFFIVPILIISVLAWNIHTVGNGWHMPKVWRKGVKSLRINQKWNMFAPYPLKSDGWYALSGTLKSGSTVGLFFRKKYTQNRLCKPEDVSQMYPNQRWRKYLMNLRRPEYSDQRSLFSSWLCYEWNVKNGNKEMLSSVNILFVEERTLPPHYDRKVDVKKVDLGSYQCSTMEMERTVFDEKANNPKKYILK